jgi:hypothetical protein
VSRLQLLCEPEKHLVGAHPTDELYADGQTLVGEVERQR